MNALLLMLLLSYYTSTSGFEVKKEGNKIFLASQYCEETVELISSLNEWSHSTGIKSSCSPPPQAVSPIKKECNVEITQCVPEHVARYQDANPEVDGPNCWNLALVLKGILPGLRYSSEDEMSFYMGPPLCRALSDQEARKPGDVGAIRAIKYNGEIEVHGLIYVSEKMAYSKNGIDLRAPYSLQPIDDVYEMYRVPKSAECRKNVIDRNLDCKRAVSFFRCVPMQDYFAAHPNLPQDIVKIYKSFDQFEHCFENTLIKGTPLSQEAVRNILESSVALSKYMESELKKEAKNHTQNQEAQFLLQSLELRLSSIAAQLGAMGADGAGMLFDGISGHLKDTREDLKDHQDYEEFKGSLMNKLSSLQNSVKSAVDELGN